MFPNYLGVCLPFVAFCVRIYLHIIVSGDCIYC
jgi:hypothetical protein